MPKKSKVVICPRCHRTIQAKEYSQHLSAHKGKKRGQVAGYVKIVPEESEVKYPKFQDFTIIPEIEKAVKMRAASQPVKSALSESQILAKFEVSLKD